MIDNYPFSIVAASSGVVSALCCIFVICLIFLLKKHYFFIQRMILYHCLAALVDSFSRILSLHYLRRQTQSAAQDTMCTISGFVTLLASWILIVDYSVITFTLLMTAVFHKNVMRLQPLYVTMIFLLPLTFNWIPFIGDSYGEAEGGWCWIRTVNYDDCTKHRLGEIFAIVLWDVLFFSILIVLIPTYLFTIVYATRERYRNTQQNIYHDPQTDRIRKNLIKDVWRILFFPFGVILLNIFVLVITVYNSMGAVAPRIVQLLHGAFGPLQGGYIALVYILDRDTFKRLTYSNVRAVITRRNTVHEYAVEAGLSESAEPTVSYTLYGDNE